ncbi:MAG TPA: hypothetical protein VFC54_14870 [Pseudolabrys sp.]|nr:hypothetical protein [Pseudolabrys sp.]
MSLPSIPPIASAQIPQIILLTIAGAACLMLIAELHARLVVPAQKPAAKTTTRERAKATVSALIVIVLASVALFLIAGLIGLGFGPFYLVICSALALIAIFTALSNPRIARRVEALSAARLVAPVTAFVIACLALALFFEALAARPALPF